jgi:hypothetical protein
VIPTIAVYLRRPDLRRCIVYIGLCGGLAGPISEYWHLKDYWRPASVFGHPFLEDIIFGAGVSAWAAVVFKVAGRRTQVPAGTGGTHRILLVTFPVGYVASMLVGVNLIGLNSIVVSVLVFVGCTAWIIVNRPDLLVAALATSLLMIFETLVGYGVVLNWMVNGRRILEESWLLDGERLGVTIIGQIPVTEIVWYGALGLLLGVVYEYLENLRVVPGDAQER